MKRANIITTNPADLKNIPDLELLFILKELKLTNAKTGNVPKAKANIVNPPLKKLPQSGTTDLDIGTQPVSTFQGTCGMGMYPFEIDFQ